MINIINNTSYIIPDSVAEINKYKYMEVINKGYVRYLHAIYLCGNICMQNQFSELIQLFNKDTTLSKKTIKVYTTQIVAKLEELGFIGTGFLNRYKYIFLRNPSFNLIAGDVQHHRRTNLKIDMRTDRFLSNLLKMQYFIEYEDFFMYSNMEEQLKHITKLAYNMIVKNGNTYGYDIDLIQEILTLDSYENIAPIINNTIESKNKLGFLRMIWSELAKEYWKIGRQNQTISREPLYLKLYVQEDGSLNIHYAPKIIIFDTSKDVNYFLKQSNKLFYMFFDLSGNRTLDIKPMFLNNNNFGHTHFNKLGYTAIVIGNNSNQLDIKTKVLNEHYYKDNKYTPLIHPCEYISVNIDKYFTYKGTNKKISKSFKDINKNIEDIIKERMK